MNKFFHVAGALLISTTIAVHGSAKEYIIKFKDASVLGQKALNVRGLGRVAFLDTHAEGSLAEIEINQKSSKAEAQALAQIIANPNVEYVTESFKLHLVDAPVDLSKLKDQWSIKKVEAEAAWNLAGNHGSHNVIVAIIDTGADLNHESLKDNLVAGYDFKNNDDTPDDEFDPNWQTTHKNPGHGTHCAGIVGATGQIAGGVVGISPEVSIMPLKFIGIDGSGDLMAAIKAIDFAISKKVDVISASWGAEVAASQAQPLIDAVKRANDAGVVFVSAAGNGDANGQGINNDEKSFFPANAIFENTITVAASDQNDAKTVWSNFGRKSVQVGSPGLQIMSTVPQNKYDLLSGTSMATPLVSGLVALLKAQNKALTGLQIRSLLEQTGTKTSIETACNCRVSASAAMDSLINAKPVLVPYAYTLAPQETVKFAMMNGSGNVTYASSNPAVATVAADGTLTGATEGETFVTATDGAGHTIKSESVFVWTRAAATSSCPLGDDATCQALCQIMPTLPWCSK